MQSPSSGPSTNPFLSSPTNNANQPIVDLFGASSTITNTESQVTKNIFIIIIFFFFINYIDVLATKSIR